jgi:hypothetical protein
LLIEGAKLCLVDGAGHGMILTHANDVNREIKEFFLRKEYCTEDPVPLRPPPAPVTFGDAPRRIPQSTSCNRRGASGTGSRLRLPAGIHRQKSRF